MGTLTFSAELWSLFLFDWSSGVSAFLRFDVDPCEDFSVVDSLLCHFSE